MWTCIKQETRKLMRNTVNNKRAVRAPYRLFYELLKNNGVWIEPLTSFLLHFENWWLYLQPEQKKYRTPSYESRKNFFFFFLTMVCEEWIYITEVYYKMTQFRGLKGVLDIIVSMRVWREVTTHTKHVVISRLCVPITIQTHASHTFF